MNFYVIFFLVICAVLLWVTIRKKEAYPFSYYPMYSSGHKIENVCVYRIALKKQDGSMAWWESEFYRYPEYVGRKLKQLSVAHKQINPNGIFLELEKRKLLIMVMRIMEKEGAEISSYYAFCIVERKVAPNLHPMDRLVETIAFNILPE
ncbi:hypothetical protein [Mucilaginibacter sp. L3T2-6]|uniref:hypothetical protein n=1 Tax=Mucilaginibacter sp. L3T2-6 TaxID=3062491 RepID=UPI0026764C4D|nr:hypothetical protein [Mucilaginibacter sp. L3T2-6]MDO3642251.1 hypothetical protein [Mucilaginibacter sp. L3T2-6]MDV6214746.1 hypothetical protein [Mucilaginibacter sp. L3T2-6]